MSELSRADDTPARFGTDAFYASLGRAFVVMCGVVPFLFLIEGLDWLTPGLPLDARGIRPRDVTSLDGIVLAPFLHVNFMHVIANSVPLILLGTFVLAGGLRRTVWSTLVIIGVAGVGTWLLGSLFFVDERLDGLTPVHIGASGVVFGYLGLLLTRGLVERSWWSAGVAVLIGVLYGWQLQGALPGQVGISWEGHLFGFIGGVLAAILFRRRRPKPAPAGPTDLGTLPDFQLPR